MKGNKSFSEQGIFGRAIRAPLGCLALPILNAELRSQRVPTSEQWGWLGVPFPTHNPRTVFYCWSSPWSLHTSQLHSLDTNSRLPTPQDPWDGCTLQELTTKQVLFLSRGLWAGDRGNTLLLITWYLQTKCTDGYNPNSSSLTMS